ncbi:hypothetical protein M8J76_001772 [Diaphorina citri]|nr:hypothetical protein M8J76_001772 [Diaphorina citri]
MLTNITTSTLQDMHINSTIPDTQKTLLAVTYPVRIQRYTKDSTGRAQRSTNFHKDPPNSQNSKYVRQTQYEYRDAQKSLLAVPNNLQTPTKIHQIVKKMVTTAKTLVGPSTNIEIHKRLCWR